MLNRLLPYRNVTHGQSDGQTNGQTDRIAISISRVSVLTRDNKTSLRNEWSGNNGLWLTPSRRTTTKIQQLSVVSER